MPAEPPERGELPRGAVPEAFLQGFRSAFLQERDPFIELLEGEPDRVRIAARAECAKLEEGVVLDDSPPTAYIVTGVIDRIASRARAVKYLFPTGIRPWPEDLKDLGLHNNHTKARTFSDALLQIAREMDARLGVAQKVIEDAAFADDIDNSAVDAFVRPGKTRAYIGKLNHILRSPETAEGLGEYGKKVNTAMELLVRVARGEAEVSVGPRGRRKKIPNIMGLPANHGLWKWVIDKYILPEMQKAYPLGPSATRENQEAWEDFKEQDDRAAVHTAIMLLRFAKVDGSFVIDSRGKLQLGRLGTGGDIGKLHVENRRRFEWFSDKGRKEHPSLAGSPVSFGCYPDVFMNLFEVATIEVPVAETNPAMLARGYREQKVRISVWDAWQGKGRAKVAVVDRDGESKGTREIEIRPRSLDQIPFDEVRVVNAESDDPFVEFAMGVNADVREIPYGLALMYAAKNFYDIVTRVDFPKLYREITETDLLFKMNKAWNIFFGILGSAKGIPKETMDKLNNYCRVVFLASLVAGVTPGEGSLEKMAIGNILTDEKGRAFSSAVVADTVLWAAVRSGFLTLKSPDASINRSNVSSNVDEGQERLYHHIVSSRRSPLPGETSSIGSGWFSPDELKQLVESGLYPLGVKR